MRLRDALLVQLLAGPRHGYQLKVEFERLTGSSPVNVGQIYTTLDRHCRDGLVRRVDDASTERGRIPYEITTDGRVEALRWLADPSNAGSDARSSVAAKVLLAHGAPGVDTMAVVDAHRAALIAAARAARQRHARSDDMVDRLLGDAQAAVAEAELRWLDLYEDEIRSTKAQEEE